MLKNRTLLRSVAANTEDGTDQGGSLFFIRSIRDQMNALNDPKVKG